MEDQFTKFGILGMENFWNCTLKKIEEIWKEDEKTQQEYFDFLIKEREIRKSQISKWAKISREVLDEELIDRYKELLTDFVMYGPGEGELMDKSMAVLMALKDSNMDGAVGILSEAEEGIPRYFIQNIAFMFSDFGPDFVIHTLKRDLTTEENLKISLKRMEIERRKNKRLINEVGNAVK